MSYDYPAIIIKMQSNLWKKAQKQSLESLNKSICNILCYLTWRLVFHELRTLTVTPLWDSPEIWCVFLFFFAWKMIKNDQNGCWLGTITVPFHCTVIKKWMYMQDICLWASADQQLLQEADRFLKKTTGPHWRENTNCALSFKCHPVLYEQES